MNKLLKRNNNVRRAGVSHCLTLVAASLLGACFNSGGSDPDAAITFSKSFGGAGHDALFSAIPTSDGGYAVTGQLSSVDRFGDGAYGLGGSLFAAKLDNFGDVQWQLATANQVGVFGRDPEFAATDDNGVCLAGIDRSNTADPQRDILIARYDETGNLLWSSSMSSGDWPGFRYVEDVINRLGSPLRDRVVQVVAMNDGGCAAVVASAGNVQDLQGGGTLYLETTSTVVAYANGSGETWTRRLTDGISTSTPGNNHSSRQLHATSQGVMVLFSFPSNERFSSIAAAQEYSNWKTLIAHYGFDGRLLDRATLDLVPIPDFVIDDPDFLQAEYQDGPYAASPEPLNDMAFLQTDDPDASGSRDGIANDGFLLRFKYGGFKYHEYLLVKLDRQMSEEWRLNDTVEFASYTPQARGSFLRPVNGGNSDRALLFEYSKIRVVNIVTGQIEDAYTEPTGGNYFDVIETAPNEFRAFVSTPSELLLVSLRGAGPVSELSRTTFPFGTFGTNQQPQLRRNGILSEGVSLFDNSGSEIAQVGNNYDVPSAGLAVVEPSPDVFWVFGLGSNGTTPGAFVAAVRAGGIVWQRSLADRKFAASNAIPDGAGGAVFLLYSSSSFQLVRLSDDGSEVWRSESYFVNTSKPRHGQSFIAMKRAQSGFVVAARSGGGHTDTALIYRFDSAGALIDIFEIPSLNVRDVSITSDDGLILAGYRPRSGLPTVVRTNQRGAILWNRTYSLRGAIGNSESPVRVQVLDGDEFALAFESKGLLSQGFATDEDGVLTDDPLPIGDSNITLMRFDADGEPLWSRVHGALYGESPHSLEVTSDGGFLIAGRSDSLGELTEAWLLRLGPDGKVGDGCNAMLGEIAGQFFSSTSSALMQSTPLELASISGTENPTNLRDSNLVTMNPDLAVARQCFGQAQSANPLDNAASDTRTLTVNQAGSMAGLVISSPSGIFCGGQGPQLCTLDVIIGNRIVVRVDDSSAAEFRGWGSNVCAEEFDDPARCDIAMDFDRTLDVFFEPSDGSVVTLNVDVVGAGHVFTTQLPDVDCRNDPSASDCVQIYRLGQRVELAIAEDPGELFQGWSGDCSQSGTAQTIVVTMDRDKICTANFTGTPTPPQRFQLDVALTLDGAPSTTVGQITSIPAGIDCGGGALNCGNAYTDGSTANLSAISRSNATFDRWTSSVPGSGCDNVANPTVAIVMSEPIVCTANFITPPVSTGLVTIDVVVGGVPRNASQWGGLISSSPFGINCGVPGVFDDCAANFGLGQSIELDVSEQPGWVFSSWTGVDPGCPSGSVFPATFTVSQQSLRCGASFVAAPANDVTVFFDGFTGRAFDENTGQLDCTSTCTVSFPVSESPIRLRVEPAPNRVSRCVSQQTIPAGVLCFIDNTSGPVSVLLE